MIEGDFMKNSILNKTSCFLSRQFKLLPYHLIIFFLMFVFCVLFTVQTTAKELDVKTNKIQNELQSSHKLEVSVLASRNFTLSQAPEDSNSFSSGIGIEYIAHKNFKNIWSIKGDFLYENFDSNDGGYQLNLRRSQLMGWGIYSRDITASCLCTFGIGLGVGTTQAVVRSSIEGSSNTASGQFEPITGILINSKVILTEKFYLEFLMRNTYSNNFSQGNRFELAAAVGYSFF